MRSNAGSLTLLSAVLALVVPHPGGAQTKAGKDEKPPCISYRAIVSVQVTEPVPESSWSGYVCPDGGFWVEAYDLKQAGRLTKARLAELRQQVASLPPGKRTTDFRSLAAPDSASLQLRTNPQDKPKWEPEADQLYEVLWVGEGHPHDPLVQSIGQILRDAFPHNQAVHLQPPPPPPPPPPAPSPNGR